MGTGHVDGEANCQGGYYSDGKNEYHNAIVSYAVTITLRDFETPVIVSRNAIHPRLFIIKYSEGNKLF